MTRSLWPGEGDLQQFVATIAGLSVSTTYNYANPIAAAVAQVERITEFAPFLSDGVTVTTRTYDPPGPTTTRPVRGGSRILRLRSGLIQNPGTPSTVTIGCDNAQTQQTLTLNTDYYLWPADAPDTGRPYTAVEFRVPQWGLPRSIQVAGVFGFSSVLPDDIWQACLQLAAAQVARDVLQGIFASPTMLKANENTIQQSDFRELGDSWAKTAKDVLQGYVLIN